MPVAGGHCKGLSYRPSALSTFASSSAAPPSCEAINVDGHACEETVSFNVSVIYGGSRDGAHAVLVYTVPPPGCGRARQAGGRVPAGVGADGDGEHGHREVHAERVPVVRDRRADSLQSRATGRQHRARPERRLVGVLSCQDRLLRLVVT